MFLFFFLGFLSKNRLALMALITLAFVPEADNGVQSVTHLLNPFPAVIHSVTPQQSTLRWSSTLPSSYINMPLDKSYHLMMLFFPIWVDGWLVWELAKLNICTNKWVSDAGGNEESVERESSENTMSCVFFLSLFFFSCFLLFVEETSPKTRDTFAVQSSSSSSSLERGAKTINETNETNLFI